MPPFGRRLVAANALLAWGGVLLTLVLSAAGAFTTAPAEPGLYGEHPVGLLGGAWSRLSDSLSYFTMWSNAVVAVSTTLLALQPDEDSFWRRVLRIAGVLMITITAIVYAVLLAPTDVVAGWSRLTNPWLHIVTPAVTILVWLLVGPRGRVTWQVVLASLALPLAWILWMLGRAAAIGAYPYGFLNIARHGVGPVATTLAAILLFGVALAAVYWGVDVLLRRVSPAGRARASR